VKSDKSVFSSISLLGSNIIKTGSLRIDCCSALKAFYASGFYINFLSFFVSLVKGLVSLLKSYINRR
jgi:hypothetical protein